MAMTVATNILAGVGVASILIAGVLYWVLYVPIPGETDDD